MRTKTPAVAMSLGLVFVVAIGAFASASFATQGLVSEKDELITDDLVRMPELRTRGDVKTFDRNGKSGYALSFTATFTPAPGAQDQLEPSDGAVPNLVMRQSISYPTLSDRQESVGPIGLPFASQTLALTVEMNGECFEPNGKSGYRLQGFDPKCTQASLSLGEQSFDVTDLFIDVDSRLKAVGRDGKTWQWRATATFEDPDYAFPIVSLGQADSTMVMIGDMVGVAGVKQVKFSGDG